MAFIRKVSPEEYARFLQAFRQTSGDYKLAASLLNMDQRTVKKAFEEGWPKAGLKAVKDIDQYDEVALKLPVVGTIVAPELPTKLAEEPLAQESGAGSEPAPIPTHPNREATRQNVKSSVSTEVEKALALLDEVRAAAIRKDLKVLESVASNAEGIQVISTQLLAGLNTVIPDVVKILTRDAKDGLAMSANQFVTALEKIVKISADGTKVLAAWREGVAALGQVGKNEPPRQQGGPVTYEHGEGGETTVTEVMSVIKRTTHKRRAGGYAGEENAEHRVVIDVKPIPPQLIDGGKVVANEPPAAPITAEPLE